MYLMQENRMTKAVLVQPGTVVYVYVNWGHAATEGHKIHVLPSHSTTWFITSQVRIFNNFWANYLQEICIYKNKQRSQENNCHAMHVHAPSNSVSFHST